MMLLLPTPTTTRRSELEKEIEIERDWVRGSCGFFAYVNPPRSAAAAASSSSLLEDTAVLCVCAPGSGPGHGRLMHNSAEF